MRNEIDFLAAAFEGGQLELKTYLSKCEGATIIRQVEIINAQTGNYCSKAKQNGVWPIQWQKAPNEFLKIF